MHTDAERKYTAKAARVRRASREDETSLLNCIRAPKGKMSAKLTGARRVVEIPYSIMNEDD